MQENRLWFKPVKIQGFIYVKDGDDKFVTVKGKVKKFKTVTKASEFIINIEYSRNKAIREEQKLKQEIDFE